MIFTENFREKLFFLCVHNEEKETGKTKIYFYIENKANLFIQGIGFFWCVDKQTRQSLFGFVAKNYKWFI